MLTLAVIVHSSPARAGAGASAPSSAPPTTRGPSPSVSTPPTTPPTTSPPAAAPVPTITVTAASAAPSPSAGRTVADAVTALPGSDTGDVAVAVTDLDGDEVAGYDSAEDSDDDTYDTASIVKVDILAALLLRKQSAGTRMTERERDLATAMIEASDNDAATALWDTIGGSAGLDAANDTLGLAHTSGGSGELWGLTQTTAKDQVTLLRAVFGSHSPLSAASRTYIAGLMRSVETGQRWGVSAADSDDSGYALKNGWLQRSATGLWDINSIGLVTYQGHELLICVLSAGQHSEAGGIDLVEDVATAAAQAFTAAA
ncbi:serine hydrolase [Streptomyces sp. KK5PA1]|uniref:Serine hydrolase n=2 Tax=Actinacidiphila acididurans TaxID=2784346 RepID=A0ABS2TTX0_9ACTN|nr:serine hydrolase [Actinacidiphila acididurans]